METRQENYTIMEGYELPSHGLIYDEKISPVMELRCMTGRDELKRLAHSTASMKVLADLVESCLIEKPKIHVYDMALGDYEYLLQRLRVVTYGSDFKMSLKCPHCGEAIEVIADLDQLTPKMFDEAEQALFKECQTFRLPDSGQVVKIKFQTPRIVDTIASKTKELKRKYKTAEIDFHLQVLLTEIIEEVDGAPLNPQKSDVFIDNLTMKDMMKILNNLDKLNSLIGVDTELLFDCPECSEEIAATFWYGPEFLRPTTI